MAFTKHKKLLKNVKYALDSMRIKQLENAHISLDIMLSLTYLVFGRFIHAEESKQSMLW